MTSLRLQTSPVVVFCDSAKGGVVSPRDDGERVDQGCRTFGEEVVEPDDLQKGQFDPIVSWLGVKLSLLLAAAGATR